MIGHSRFHHWCDSQRLVNPAEIVSREDASTMPSFKDFDRRSLVAIGNLKSKI